jgi:hypothetical protein
MQGSDCKVLAATCKVLMSTSKVLTLRAGSGELACRIGLRVGPIDRPGCGGRLPAAGCGDHSSAAGGWPSLADFRPYAASCSRSAARAFFCARCTDMALISSREGACRSERPSRTVSRRAVAWVAGSGQLIDQLLQRQLLPRPAGSQLRLRRSQLLELNGEANNFADGGVPSIGGHRLLTLPQTTDPTPPAPAAGCGTRRTGESRCS